MSHETNEPKLTPEELAAAEAEQAAAAEAEAQAKRDARAEAKRQHQIETVQEARAEHARKLLPVQCAAALAGTLANSTTNNEELAGEVQEAFDAAKLMAGLIAADEHPLP
jgi:hypothetical protein